MILNGSIGEKELAFFRSLSNSCHIPRQASHLFRVLQRVSLWPINHNFFPTFFVLIIYFLNYLMDNKHTHIHIGIQLYEPYLLAHQFKTSSTEGWLTRLRSWISSFQQFKTFYSQEEKKIIFGCNLILDTRISVCLFDLLTLSVRLRVTPCILKRG